MNDQTLSPLLTSQGAAEYLKISEKTLRKDRSLKHLGIPYVRIGSRIRYDVDAVRAWVDHRMIYTRRRGRPPKAIVMARMATAHSERARSN